MNPSGFGKLDCHNCQWNFFYIFQANALNHNHCLSTRKLKLNKPGLSCAKLKLSLKLELKLEWNLELNLKLVTTSPDLHVNFCLSVCLFVCLSVFPVFFSRRVSG